MQIALSYMRFSADLNGKFFHDLLNIHVLPINIEFLKNILFHTPEVSF